MLDGVHFGEHPCVVALGIAIDGTKVPLALVEGASENATLARELLTGLRARPGHDPADPVRHSTAPRRCAAPPSTCSTTQSSPDASSTRSATSATGSPSGCKAWSSGACAPPWHAASALDAQAQLEALAGELDKTTPVRRRRCGSGWPRR
jgi:putative transposase